MATRGHLADMRYVRSYEVRIEFTDPYEPSLISGRGIPFPSVQTEIAANALTKEAATIREKYGRIPYGSPLYLWELKKGKTREVLYIGQTVLQGVQKRFEGHSAVVKLLAQYVNDKASYIYYRLCSRLDLSYEKGDGRIVRAIEHFPLGQAKKLINDVEAYLIFHCKPKYNKKHKDREKRYWKPFSVGQCKNIYTFSEM